MHGKLCQINRVKDSFNRDTLHMIISALIMSKLYLYCSSVWSNTSSANIHSETSGIAEFCVQNHNNHFKIWPIITPSIQEIGWLPVREHLLYRDSIMTFKCMNGLMHRRTWASFSVSALQSMIVTQGTTQHSIM